MVQIVSVLPAYDLSVPPAFTPTILTTVMILAQPAVVTARCLLSVIPLMTSTWYERGVHQDTGGYVIERQDRVMT